MAIFIIPAISMHKLYFAVDATTPEEAIIKLSNSINIGEEYAQEHTGLFVNIDIQTPLVPITEKQYKQEFYSKNPYLIETTIDPMSYIMGGK